MGRTLRPMSISTTTRKAGPFTGNGVRVSFPFAFKVFAAADVLVVRGEIATSADTQLTLGTHYSVALNSDQDTNPGGTVNWIGTPLSSAFTLTIGSKVTSTQPATFTNLGRFYPRVLNDALDRLTIVVQQLAEEVSRSVKVGFSGLVSPDELVSTITTAASTATAGASSAASSAETALTVLGDALSAVDTANAAIAGAVRADGSVAMAAELELAGNAAGALGAVPKQQLDAGLLLVCPPGSIKPMARLTAPAGWLLIDGKTIGGAASGATARANADTWLLFEQVWAFPAGSVPIFDSAGAASVRGASAAADFAAGKRLALFTPDGGAFMRMWTPGQTTDAGRAEGSAQAAYAGSFTVSTSADDGDSGVGSFQSVTGVWFNGVQIVGNGAGSGTVTVTPGDARGYNLAMPHYIKL